MNKKTLARFCAPYRGFMAKGGEKMRYGRSAGCSSGFAGVLFLLTLVPFMVYAAVPQYVSFQGKVTEDGIAISDDRTITFSLWDNATGGDPASGLWNETQSVEIIDGIYNVELGLVTPLPADLYTNDDLFLQVDILHPTLGMQRLSPLMPLNSTMFALKSANADMALSAVDADTLDTHDSIFFQQRVTGSCAPESSIRQINADGTVVCESVGDIKGVYAGAGLSGGGGEGEVFLNVKPLGIDNNMIQDNAVASAKIQDNAVTSAKIQNDAVTSVKIQDDAVTRSNITEYKMSAGFQNGSYH